MRSIRESSATEVSETNCREITSTPEYGRWQSHLFPTFTPLPFIYEGRQWWTWIFVVFFLAIMVLFLGSQQGSQSIQPNKRGVRPPILLVDDFYYPPESGTLSYPTCKLTKGFEFPGCVTSQILAIMPFCPGYPTKRRTLTSTCSISGLAGLVLPWTKTNMSLNTEAIRTP